MEMKIDIKAGAVHHLADARYFSTFAEWIGFDFNPASPNLLSIATAKELIGWLAGPKIIGEFGESEAAVINQYVSELGLEIIQTDFLANREDIHPGVKQFIYRIVVDKEMSGDILASILSTSKVDYFLLDLNAFTSGWMDLKEQTDISLSFLQEICEQYPIILDLPFERENVLELLEQLQPVAINLKGGAEEKVGLKSFEVLDQVVEVLEVD